MEAGFSSQLRNKIAILYKTVIAWFASYGLKHENL